MIKRDEIFAYVRKKYGTQPEYLWDIYPSYAVLRHDDNEKWFGIVMSVPKSKLGLSGDGAIELIDLKLDPEDVEKLKKKKGYLPAYHMNKEHWLSILFDGSISMKEITERIDSSYALTK